MAHQLALALPYVPSYKSSDFVVAACNRDAACRVMGWPHWSSHGLVIWGEGGCGKTHLASLWAEKANATFLSLNQITDVHVWSGSLQSGSSVRRPNAELPPPCYVVDNVQGDGAPQSADDEVKLFHVLNTIKEMNGFALLIGRHPPRSWPVVLPDLRSRLMALDSVGIDPLTDDLMAPLMLKLFADAQIVVGDSLVTYALTRLTRSYAAVHLFVQACYHRTLLTQKPLCYKDIRSLLSPSLGDGYDPCLS